MDSETFYGAVLPPLGHRVLAIFKAGLGQAPTHQYFSSNDDLIEAAEAYDRLQKNVYHACATYTTATSRKGDNVKAVKSLWVDLDVGPNKPYDSQKSAASAIINFSQAFGLDPYLVKSGGGVHVYYPLSVEIEPEQWKRLAAAFAAVMDHFGVMHDTSRTEDIASILRVPNTRNYKTDPAKDVKIVRAGTALSAQEIYAKFQQYADTHGLLLTEKAKVTAATNELIGTKDYPPSEGDRIAEKCDVLYEVDETGGDVSYEIWWRALGVAKHTTDPDAVAIRWTRERAKSHEKTDWATLMAEWKTGPTTCAEFSKHSTKCAGCKFNGKVVSPIQLGQTEESYVDPRNPIDVDPPKKALRDDWEFGAQWIKDRLQAECRIGYKNGQLTTPVADDSGATQHLPWCDRYWQVMRRVRNEDGTWALEISYVQYKGKPPRTFLLSSAAVTAADILRKEFSARELHLYGGPKATQKAMDKIRYEQNLLYGNEAETPTYPVMGWVTENNLPRGHLTGEFVLGNTIFAPKKTPTDVLLAETVYQDVRQGFPQAGTIERWTTIIDNIYNRPGAEAYQFVIAAMFASPLVPLVPGAGDWHGIPLALHGDSGAAKTTTALVGMSIYGPPQMLRFNANSDHKNGGQGDTVNALALKVGTLQNIPFIADEMTGLEPEKMSSIMYMLANGKSKDRMAPNGQMIPNPYRWDVISLATGNEGFHAKMEQLRNRNTQEASMLRCFEIPFKASDLRTVFPDIDRTYIEDDLLAQQYGCVGRSWIQFLVNNRMLVADILGKRRASFKIDDHDRSSLRFYKDLLVTVEVAAMLAKKRGFINWDIDAMMTWAKNRLRSLTETVFDEDWDSVISEFIGSLHGRTIVTKHYKTGPGRRSKNVEMSMEPLSTNAAPVARRATEDRTFVVTVSHLNDWAKEHKLTGKALAAQMWAGGYLTGKTPEPRLLNIGSGTNVVKSQAACYELDYAKCVEFSKGDDADVPDNVVQLQRPEAVEQPQQQEAV